MYLGSLPVLICALHVFRNVTILCLSLACSFSRSLSVYVCMYEREKMFLPNVLVHLSRVPMLCKQKSHLEFSQP